MSGQGDFEINPTGVATSSIPIIHLAQKLPIHCNNDPTVFILLIIILEHTHLNFTPNSAHDSGFENMSDLISYNTVSSIFHNIIYVNYFARKTSKVGRHQGGGSLSGCI